ncbi:1-deoxy-D-xylulose-5-phosphate reductoisomerase [Amylibacter sp. SFDW26]|uniref:1-deoxy-D-xylulose-5-phosphate reductoisomerase n=1 Tax=Amylibacter sp. SFDW26 TaxID=2652722 RepID=UPI0012619FED|nr:1-deoxy-D-xylulose-5-phosphate reductoisomerase [Amylibacter sp. SFDW26]KAB7615880.1 1-deoxy-D-xylulose-5-phosphate reductoisomerase [Amylibacter sp. SFDW26]
MRRISIFGATGSVGQNTVKIIKGDQANFNVIAVSGGKNIKKLAEIAKTLDADIAITSEMTLLDELKDLLKGTSISVQAGREALIDAASQTVDWAMSAVVGFAGLELSLAIAKHSKTLALANKESLVCGGVLLKDTCKQSGCRLLPVDSEHSAIFQSLVGENIRNVERIILTASGGPFLNTPLAEMAKVTPEQAADHPNWSMGKRISIDSASMFNKAMEIIETKELFDVKSDQIEAVIHPQSIIHSMVGFNDGSIMAQMGHPDMCSAIGYALYWPDRKDAGVKRLDFSQLSQLDFQQADTKRFPAIHIAHDVMKMGGLSGAVFNAAKEQTLDLFLDAQIGFLDMADLVAKTVHSATEMNSFSADSMDKITKADTWARSYVNELAGCTK